MKTLSKLSFVAFLIINVQTTFAQQNYLTGIDHKDWYKMQRTPEADNPSCRPSSAHSQDNTFTFYADGTFEFDNGELIEDKDCQEEGCCSDFVDLVGTWEFTNGNTGIIVTALHEKGDPDNAINETLFDASIEQLNENMLRLRQLEPKTGEEVQVVFEVR